METDLVTVMHNQHIGSLDSQKRKQLGHCPIRRMSANGTSFIVYVVSMAIGK
jgi:hypothetical protein